MTADLRELLKFYAEAGADEAIEEKPIDRFAEFSGRAAEQAKTSAREQPGAGSSAPRESLRTGLSGPSDTQRPPRPRR